MVRDRLLVIDTLTILRDKMENNEDSIITNGEFYCYLYEFITFYFLCNYALDCRD